MAFFPNLLLAVRLAHLRPLASMVLAGVAGGIGISGQKGARSRSVGVLGGAGWGLEEQLYSMGCAWRLHEKVENRHIHPVARNVP